MSGRHRSWRRKLSLWLLIKGAFRVLMNFTNSICSYPTDAECFCHRLWLLSVPLTLPSVHIQDEVLHFKPLSLQISNFLLFCFLSFFLLFFFYLFPIHVLLWQHAERPRRTGTIVIVEVFWEMLEEEEEVSWLCAIRLVSACMGFNEEPVY